MKAIIAIAALLTLLVYLVSAFIAWSWNPGSWAYREIAASLWTMLMLFLAMIAHDRGGVA